MSWIAPWFLLGAAAIALPWWLHRLQARPLERVPFSSVMLLEAAQQRLQHRRELRYRALLALRIALLGVLALAFAQPVWRRPAAASVGVPLQLIVLDTSLSMNASGRFEHARALASKLIDDLPAGGRALLISAADGVSVVPAGGTLVPTTDRAALHAALSALGPGNMRLDYGAAMAGLDALLGNERGTVLAHLISDFQDSGMPARFNDLLPRSAPLRHITLQLHPLDQDTTPNWAVMGIERQGDGVDVRLRGFNTPAARRTVTLEVGGKSQQASADVAAGAQTVLHFPVQWASGDNRVVARLTDADSLAADNTYYAVVRNTPTLPVAILTAEPDAVAVKYLVTALANTGAQVQGDVQTLSQFDSRRLERYRWVIVPDLGAVDPTLAASLRQYVDDGGAVLAALGTRSVNVKQLPLMGDSPRSTPESADDLAVSQVNTGHPLLNDLSGWDDIHIAHMASIAPARGDQVLMTASNDEPLLLERPMGRGRVLLFTSSLDNDWNDLPVQPLFVGLLAQSARYLGGGEGPTPQRLTGERLTLARNEAGAGQVVDPAGGTALSLSDTRLAPTVKLDQVGFYQVYTRDQEAAVAVNPDLRESDLTPMTAGALSRWQRAAAAATNTASVPGTVQNPAGVSLARLLLAALAVLALAESLLGNAQLKLETAKP